MFRFISFGSGSSGNCYLLYTGNDALLIDAGVGVRKLKRDFALFGLSLSMVHNILITHDHADHVKSVGRISGDGGIPVYTTRLVHDGINHNYCVRKKIEPSRAMTIEAGEEKRIGDFVVKAFHVPHDSTDNVGYRIGYDGVNFTIITDAGEITTEMASYISDADYLVIEANHDEEMLQAGPYPEYLKQRILSGSGHLSNKNCARALVENMSPKLKHVWLCHLSNENNHPELAKKTVEAILHDGGVDVGGSLKLDVLKRTTPTGEFELLP